ncbi:MAG: hypothetical protein OEY01_10125 [Desulfobulbaceae bacterium]|nr:hypothetical protein [Desulfobulbaceae bacterium]HIJ79330.1 hypothetical protein [Deltaproteobacteria bacterium]
MVIYIYDEKKGLLNLTNATTIEYYGKSPRRVGFQGGTTLLVSYPDGNRYFVYGVSLNDLHLIIAQGKSRTFIRSWERIGPVSDLTLEFE